MAQLIAKLSIILALFSMPTVDLLAQGDAEGRRQKTALDDSPILSARAAGMGGALSALADGNDASYQNPAAIGGLQSPKTKKGIRQFYFFNGGLSMNQNSTEINQEFRKKGAAQDTEVGKAIVDAHEGERQFARVSLFPNIGFSRVIFGPIIDNQLAAVAIGNETDLVELHYQQRMGMMSGFSITDPSGRLYLGMSTTYLTIKEIRGEFLYEDMANKKARNDAFKDYTNNYSGTATNLGLIWKIANTASPSLSVVGRNVGGAKYKKTKGDGDDEFMVKPDLTMGLSVSPPLGKWGFFNFSFEGARLNDKDVTIKKKWRAGAELTLSGNGAESGVALRAGANDAGTSYGAHFNLGLLGAQYANFAEDIGFGNTRVIERRQAFIVSVNLAE